jgi:hypothetical protein
LVREKRVSKLDKNHIKNSGDKENGHEHDGDVLVKYLKLLEKHEQQSKLALVMEEQLSGLRSLIEECTSENQHLVNMLKEKEEQEKTRLQEIELLKKQAEKDKQERERLTEERLIHEKIIKRLNEKLSVV